MAHNAFVFCLFFKNQYKDKGMQANFVYRKIKDFNPKTGQYESVEKWVLEVKEDENSEPVTFYYSSKKQFLEHLKAIDEQKSKMSKAS